MVIISCEYIEVWLKDIWANLLSIVIHGFFLSKISVRDGENWKISSDNIVILNFLINTGLYGIFYTVGRFIQYRYIKRKRDLLENFLIK